MKIFPAVFALFLFSTLFFPAAGEQPQGVEETPMGPATGDRYLSADGDHIAIAGKKGSRVIMIVDGVNGPGFDAVGLGAPLSPKLQVALSATGGHCAYLGCRGDDLVVMIDGKEWGVAGKLSTSGRLDPTKIFTYSQDGAHLLFPVMNDDRTMSLVVDGTKQGSYTRIDQNTAVGAGSHTFIIAETADTNFHLVVDGKEGKGYASIGYLQISPDGAHYAYIAALETKGAAVVTDGVEGHTYPDVSDLEITPGGVPFYLRTPEDDHSGYTDLKILVVGTKEIGSSILRFQKPNSNGALMGSYAAVSSDGSKIAYVKHIPGAHPACVVIDGVAGPSYDSIEQMRFSPDGKRVVYVGKQGVASCFVVVDGKESDETGNLIGLYISPDSKRVAYITFNSGNYAVNVDGVEGPKPREYHDGRFVFSPDSQQYAFAATFGVMGYNIVLNGEVDPVFVADFERVSNSGSFYAPLQFSPDSKHLAYTKQLPPGDTSTIGLVVDHHIRNGAYSFFVPTYSPDSKHFAAIGRDSQNCKVIVDGSVRTTCTSFLDNAGSFKFVDNDTLRFYETKDGQIYKVTVKAGDSSIADYATGTPELPSTAKESAQPQPNRPGSNPPPTENGNESGDLRPAIRDADRRLNVAYQQLGNKLSRADQITLKRDETRWIKVKESCPANSQQELDCIEARIKELDSWNPRAVASSNTDTDSGSENPTPRPAATPAGQRARDILNQFVPMIPR